MTYQRQKEIRLKIFNRLFPDSQKDIIKIFGNELPSAVKVLEWQKTWRIDGGYKVQLNDSPMDNGGNDLLLKRKATNLCTRLKIHPYFTTFLIVDDSGDIHLNMVFYDSEDATMFKLGWNA